MYFWPFRVNLVPEALTNPVDTGCEVVGGAVVWEVVVAGGGFVGVVDPGRHCEYHSFCTTQDDPLAQAIFLSGLRG